MATALCDQKVPDEDAVVVSGIGCSSRFPFFVNTYGIHTLHGRALPVATGVKTANPDLTAGAVAGDGDASPSAATILPTPLRRNVNITFLVFDNGIYGLTKGQTSPTPSRARSPSPRRSASSTSRSTRCVVLGADATFAARWWTPTASTCTPA